jgi:superfamily II DNA helicase RecQ
MSIQYKFFLIPMLLGNDEEESLNFFLRNARILNVRRKIVCQDNFYYWAVAVEYLSGTAPNVETKKFDPNKKRIDYNEELSPENFAIFAKLRDWRKITATREGVQLYTIFVNEQLAMMVEKRVVTKEALMEINGVGSSRVSKYGDEVLAILREEFSRLEGKNEESRESVSKTDN